MGDHNNGLVCHCFKQCIRQVCTLALALLEAVAHKNPVVLNAL